jgi:hypothetical protein
LRYRVFIIVIFFSRANRRDESGASTAQASGPADAASSTLHGAIVAGVVDDANMTAVTTTADSEPTMGRTGRRRREDDDDYDDDDDVDDNNNDDNDIDVNEHHRDTDDDDHFVDDTRDENDDDDDGDDDDDEEDGNGSDADDADADDDDDGDLDGEPCLSNLKAPLFEKIMSYLPLKDVLAVGEASTTLRVRATSNSLWLGLIERAGTMPLTRCRSCDTIFR